MFDIILGYNADTFTATAYGGDTLRSVLESNDIDYTTGAVHLDAAPIRPGDLDKTFSEIGVDTEKRHTLIVVKKLNNA